MLNKLSAFQAGEDSNLAEPKVTVVEWANFTAIESMAGLSYGPDVWDFTKI